MKRSVNLRRKPKRTTGEDLLYTLRKLGMTDEEIKEEVLKMRAKQGLTSCDHSMTKDYEKVCPGCGKYVG